MSAALDGARCSPCSEARASAIFIAASTRSSWSEFSAAAVPIASAVSRSVTETLPRASLSVRSLRSTCSRSSSPSGSLRRVSSPRPFTPRTSQFHRVPPAEPFSAANPVIELTI